MGVHVVKGKRGKWLLRWTSKNKLNERSTDLVSTKSNYKSALKLAAELEQELAGDLPPRLMLSKRQSREVNYPDDPEAAEQIDGRWEVYRKYFFEVHMSGLSPGYRESMNAILDKFQRWANLDHVAQLTAPKGRRWIAKLREEGRPASTIRSYWRHLTAFLSLAVDDGLIKEMPKIRLPKLDATSLAKGRPINLEEFERMKEAAKKVRPKGHNQLAEFLEGLWLSGLRIGEAYRLTWSDSSFCLDMSNRPKFVIKEQKNRKRQLLPMVPEFAKSLEKVSGMKRHGFVFQIDKANGERISLRQLEKIVAACGKRANIRIDKTKTATAHDLRRSFAARWAMKVLPQVLQQLMRHDDIGTTMKYYANLDADRIADQLYETESLHGQERGQMEKKKARRHSG